MYRGIGKRRAFGTILVSLTSIGLSAPSPYAAPGPVALSNVDTALMVDITAEYLQERADTVTIGEPAEGRASLAAAASSRVSARLSLTLARDKAKLAFLRTELRQANGGYTHADVQVIPGTFTINGDEATAEVTEDARLYYPNPAAGDPEYEEYSIPHTMTFVRGPDGGWLLDSDKIEENLTGPGPITQLTEPVGAPASDADTEGEMEAGSGTAPTSETDGDKPVEDSSTAGQVTTRAAAAGYHYGKMVSYANKYWKNANTDYRRYGSDCTNFISQAMLAGGWKTTSGSFVSRKDNKKWFYGSFESTTSYTWAGAENWYWFAKKHSKRTKSLDNVWKLLSADVLQADWKRDGIIDHTMIVTKRGGGGEIYLTYHTPSKHNVKLSTLLRKYPNAAWYAHRT